MKKKWNRMISVLGFVAGVGLGGYKIWKLGDQALSEQEKKNQRTSAYYEILNEWLRLKNEGLSLEKFFVDRNYYSIAIYGFAELGKRLEEELRDSNDVEIAYLIDKNPDGIYSHQKIYAPSKELPKVDVIVVTPTFAYNEIEKMLKDMIDFPVISIEDVVYDI